MDQAQIASAGIELLNTTSSLSSLLVVGVKWPPETFIQRKLESLAARGIQVTMVVLAPRTRVTGGLNGVRVLRLSHPDDPRVLQLAQFAKDLVALLFTNPKRWAKIVAAARAKSCSSLKDAFGCVRTYTPLAALRPDIVHFEWNSAAIDYFPMFDIWDCPAVVSCRGSQINVRPHVPGNEKFIEGLSSTFRRVAAVHCVSAKILQEAQKYGLNPVLGEIIYPAVDPERFRPSSAPRVSDGTFRIITTGSLAWVKGYEYALQAIKALVDNGIAVHFDIVGDGVEFQRVLYTIHDLGLEKFVKLHGRLVPAEVIRLLQRADVFLLSSVSEGLSNAVLEAMACGLPIVTSDCGGMNEAIADGIEGFLTPVRDACAMADALGKLAANSELRQQMASAGRTRILQEFSLDRQIEQWLRLYHTVLEGSLQKLRQANVNRT
jgi:colanic acid/amylovoran biosynthesis glycosyltransferase